MSSSACVCVSPIDCYGYMGNGVCLRGARAFVVSERGAGGWPVLSRWSAGMFGRGKCPNTRKNVRGDGHNREKEKGKMGFFIAREKRRFYFTQM